MLAKIVIGLGYGDEGKGVMTNHLSSILGNPIVVRFSGGQQAGHTVVIDGVKHTHANFGAGTLGGIPSYFTEHTTIYPTTLVNELEVLKDKGVKPVIYFHPKANLTTPFDVMANRGDIDNLDDGSCGMGVGKTMLRNETSPYKLYAIDLLNIPMLIDKLTAIAALYYEMEDSDDNIWLNQEIERYSEAIQSFEWKMKPYSFLTECFSNIIFEGSQGILLDKDHGVFPHVTYANTTSKNAVEICKELGIGYEIYYVTRCYSTRHGNGPFKEEELTLINNQDENNVSNEYQGSFKISDVNYDMLNIAISFDSIYSGDTNKNLVVTCLDQRPYFNFEYENIGAEFEMVYEFKSPDGEEMYYYEP